MLELLTLVNHGSAEEVSEARDELTSKGLSNLIGQEYTDIHTDSVNFDTHKVQQTEGDRMIALFEADTSHKRKRMLCQDKHTKAAEPATLNKRR